MLNTTVSKQNSGIASLVFLFRGYPTEILSANSLYKAAFRNTKFLQERNIYSVHKQTICGLRDLKMV